MHTTLLPETEKYFILFTFIAVEPSAPKISRITEGTLNNSCSLTVEWNPASEGNQCPIKAYKVYYREVLPGGTNQTWREELVHQPASYRLNLKNLKCGTEYEIAVTANNTKGESAKSESVKERTTGKSSLYRRTRTRTHTCTHARTHTHTNTHTCTLTHASTHTHTHTHTRTH